MKRTILFCGVLAFLVYVFRKPLQELYEQRVSGLQAAVENARGTGYTTYNTQVYVPPVWTPVLKFFKAGSYAPGTQDASSAQAVVYSEQG